MPPGVLVDRGAAGQCLPPGAEVVRSAGIIERIDNPIVNTGERRAHGLDLRMRADREFDRAALAVDVRWLHLSRYEVWTAGATRFTHRYTRAGAIWLHSGTSTQFPATATRPGRAVSRRGRATLRP